MNVSKVIEARGGKVLFEDSAGGRWLFDARDYMSGSWYSMLADEEYFSKAEPFFADGIGWPEGQSIGPEDIEEFSIPAA